MQPLFAPTWEDSPCIYCNNPVGSDGETDDGEYYSCAQCRESIGRERERVVITYRILSMDGRAKRRTLHPTPSQACNAATAP